MLYTYILYIYIYTMYVLIYDMFGGAPDLPMDPSLSRVPDTLLDMNRTWNDLSMILICCSISG